MKNNFFREKNNIWYPCSQMKDYETFSPIRVHSAKGAELFLEDGTKVFDATSSWWCKSLGHGHPRLKKALKKQMNLFEHVILANTTNPVIFSLSKELSSFFPSLDKVFYGGDGSIAVEIAVKMSLHSRKITNEKERCHFMALQNGYHGETVMALALSDLGIYKKDYERLLPEVFFLRNIPYVSSKEDDLWDNCEAYWADIELQLEPYKKKLTAFILEPILQGAGGMKVYSKDFLFRLRRWTKQNNIHLIADEIMTGFGRTGTCFASQHGKIEPDFVCVSKGLTAGWMAMSAVLTSTKIYSLFYDEYEKGTSFLHSNTYAGNALAAAVALEALAIYREEGIFESVCEREPKIRKLMEEVQMVTKRLKNIRSIGAMVAADLDVPEENKRRFGFELYQIAVKNGVLLRPLGNTIYWLAPLNTPMNLLELCAEKTAKSLLELDV